MLYQAPSACGSASNSRTVRPQVHAVNCRRGERSVPRHALRAQASLLVRTVVTICKRLLRLTIAHKYWLQRTYRSSAPLVSLAGGYGHNLGRHRSWQHHHLCASAEPALAHFPYYGVHHEEAEQRAGQALALPSDVRVRVGKSESFYRLTRAFSCESGAQSAVLTNGINHFPLLSSKLRGWSCPCAFPPIKIDRVMVIVVAYDSARGQDNNSRAIWASNSCLQQILKALFCRDIDCICASNENTAEISVWFIYTYTHPGSE